MPLLDPNKKQVFTFHINDAEITDVDDLAVLSDHLTDATILLYYLEETASEVGLNTNSKNRNFYAITNIIPELSNLWKNENIKAIKVLPISKASLFEQKET